MSRHRARKRFGQHFLIDDNIRRKIVAAAAPDEGTGILEIGPGQGALTEHFIDAAGGVLAYEIDRDLGAGLQPMFDDERHTLIVGDVLEADIAGDLERHLPDVDRIIAVGNLPYNITTPILMRFLEEGIAVDAMIFMMQKEVADRISGQPSTKDYNALSVLVDYRADVTKLFHVSRHVFRPKPRVDSAVVRIDVRETPKVTVADEAFFIDLVRAAFRQRRKTCVNNLAAFLPELEKQSITAMMEELGYARNVRSEALSMEDFAIIADALHARIGRE
jgi:16S rRNA (adenine1518-N6/adenine1519-N6)-dimethyltransferase